MVPLGSLEFAYDLYAGSCEYILFMRCVGEFAGQVLTSEVQLFVQVSPPFGTIGHVIDDAMEGDQLTGAAFALVLMSSRPITIVESDPANEATRQPIPVVTAPARKTRCEP
jgi:hypothetical protein